MNKNLSVLLDTLLKNTEILEKFLSQENIDDLYKFCVSVIDGYTFSEFKEFLNTIACEDLQYQISDDYLMNVAGGTGPATKVASAALSGMLLAGGSGMVGAHGLSNGQQYYSSYQDNVSISQKSNTNHNELKEKIAKIKNSSNNNQKDNFKKITATARNVYNNKNENENVENESNENVSRNTNRNNKNSEYSINKFPTASTIQYKQKLSQSALSGGQASVPGTFTWENVEYTPHAGQQSLHVKFTPNDNNLKPKIINVKVNVLKATPKFSYRPSASSIVYGQTLDQSKLTNGKFDVEGKWSWEDGSALLDAGTHERTAIFTPNDSQNYKSVPVKVFVLVKKQSSFIRRPHTSEITYGDSLKASRILGATTNTAGSIQWENPNEKLDAGTYTRTIVFKPYDSQNYSSVKINAQVTVKKATPRLTKTTFETEYKDNMVVGDIRLPSGWSWDLPYAHLNRAGQFKFDAIYRGDKNHNKSTATITIKVTKAAPHLSMPEITYSQNKKLRSVPLPRGWHWQNEDETISTFKSYYKAYYNSNEDNTGRYYSAYDIDVYMKVRKAEPKIRSWPSAQNDIIYGDDTSEVMLQGGYSKTKGTFRLVENIHNLNAGTHMCRVVFTPKNPNFKEVTSEISITILKNMTPAKSPLCLSLQNAKRSDTSITFKVPDTKDPIEFSIDGGRTWQNSSTFENLLPDTTYKFVQRYKDTKSRCAGKISKAVSISTKHKAPEAPEAPKVVKYTNHKIILEKADNTLEYSVDNGKTWQDSPEFENLSGSTKYEIVARTKETASTAAGKKSDVVKLKTRSWIGNIWHNIFS